MIVWLVEMTAEMTDGYIMIIHIVGNQLWHTYNEQR